MTQETTHLPNWTGLLGWSTNFHDGTSSSQLGPMDEERKQWLEQAMNSAFDGQEDPNAMMAKAVTEISEGRISAGLDLLDYGSDLPGCAENVEKVGALTVMIALIESESPDVVSRSVGILNLYLSNNPRIQLAAALRFGLLDKLRTALGKFSDNPGVVYSLISCVGCLVRNVESLENGFIRDNHFDWCLDLAEHTESTRVLEKVMGLVAFMGQRHKEKMLPYIRRMVSRVYSMDGIDAFQIQFWDSAARLAELGNDMGGLVQKRLAWLKSLDSTTREDFTDEFQILDSIV